MFSLFEISLYHYIVVSSMLFAIGVFGLLLNRKSLISALMSLELILFASNINFVAFSSYLGDLVGQIFVLFVFAVAAAEIAIGLSIIVLYFRNNDSLSMNEINSMKG